MAEYCSYDDVVNILTTPGVNYFADVDGDGTVGTDDRAQHVTPNIRRAGWEVDRAVLQNGLSTEIARGQQTQCLKDVAAPIAAELCCMVGGGGVPESIASMAAWARGELLKYSQGETIPGIVYPAQPSGDYKTSIARHWPRVVNFGIIDRNGHRHRC